MISICYRSLLIIKINIIIICHNILLLEILRIYCDIHENIINKIMYHKYMNQ